MRRSRCSRCALPTPRTRFHDVDGKSRREPPIDVSPIAAIKLLYSTTPPSQREKTIAAGKGRGKSAERDERDPDERPDRAEGEVERPALHHGGGEEGTEDRGFDQHPLEGARFDEEVAQVGPVVRVAVEGQ